MRRGLDFELDEATFDALRARGCAYCGLRDDAHVGIDRVSSALGYLQGNCTGCCSSCNFMKKAVSLDAFLAMARAVAQKSGNGGDAEVVA